MTAFTNPELIRALPKTDLHVHLDGSMRMDTLIELARERNVELPAWTEEGLKQTVFLERYEDLGAYLHGFKYTCAVLRDAVALERCAYELAVDNFDEGVRYFEVRFAPQLHVSDTLTLEQTVQAVADGLQRASDEYNARPEILAAKEPPFRSGIIVCAMRMFTAGFSPFYAKYVELHQYRPLNEIVRQAAIDLVHAAVDLRDRLGLPIVGFDLAGQENGYPAGVHEQAYDFAHRNFLKKTVHAGEAFGPESIFQAITSLKADRIGHGYHLFSPERIQSEDIADREGYVELLAEYIADRRITVEVCLTSNMQTMPELTSLSQHHFGRMLDARLSATLCTDNRTVSRTTVCNELSLAIEAFDIPPSRVKNLCIHGFKRSFFDGSYNQKRAYVRQIIDYYDQVARRFGL